MELADGPTRRGEVANGRCLFARNLSVTRSAVREKDHVKYDGTLMIRA
jgi:hypothetical protein